MTTFRASSNALLAFAFTVRSQTFNETQNQHIGTQSVLSFCFTYSHFYALFLVVLLS